MLGSQLLYSANFYALYNSLILILKAFVDVGDKVLEVETRVCGHRLSKFKKAHTFLASQCHCL